MSTLDNTHEDLNNAENNLDNAIIYLYGTFKKLPVEDRQVIIDIVNILESQRSNLQNLIQEKIDPLHTKSWNFWS